MKVSSHFLAVALVVSAGLSLVPFTVNSSSLFRTDKDNRFTWYLPVSAPRKATPVIVALAGSGAYSEKDIYMWAFPAGKNGFALVDVEGDYPKLTSQELDLGQIQARIDLAIKDLVKKKKLVIDRKKVFITGTAAGGAAAIGLMLKYPGKYRAAALMGGSLISFGTGGMLGSAKGQEFFIFHGTRDKVIGLTYMANCRQRLERNGAHVEVYVHEKGGSVLPSHIYGKAVARLSELK